MNTAFFRRLGALLLVLAPVLVAASAAAQAGMATIDAAAHADHGAYLVDGAGMSLYLFTQDGDDGSACEGGCADAWPPLLVDGQVAFGEGVDLGAIGSIERNDGTQQLTYAGSPLYTFARDGEPGDASGHGVNDAWFLVTPSGEAVAAAASTVGDDDLDQQMTVGARVYGQICASCHGADGDEALVSHAVPLAGNDRAVSNAVRVLRRIVHGGSYMPGFGDRLSDEEVAAVATYVRNSWGNDEPPVSVEEVMDVR